MFSLRLENEIKSHRSELSDEAIILNTILTERSDFSTNDSFNGSVLSPSVRENEPFAAVEEIAYSPRIKPQETKFLFNNSAFATRNYEKQSFRLQEKINSLKEKIIQTKHLNENDIVYLKRNKITKEQLIDLIILLNGNGDNGDNGDNSERK